MAHKLSRTIHKSLFQLIAIMHKVFLQRTHTHMHRHISSGRVPQMVALNLPQHFTFIQRFNAQMPLALANFPTPRKKDARSFVASTACVMSNSSRPCEQRWPNRRRWKYLYPQIQGEHVSELSEGSALLWIHLVDLTGFHLCFNFNGEINACLHCTSKKVLSLW